MKIRTTAIMALTAFSLMLLIPAGLAEDFTVHTVHSSDGTDAFVMRILVVNKSQATLTPDNSIDARTWIDVENLLPRNVKYDGRTWYTISWQDKLEHKEGFVETAIYPNTTFTVIDDFITTVPGRHIVTLEVCGDVDFDVSGLGAKCNYKGNLTIEYFAPEHAVNKTTTISTTASSTEQAKAPGAGIFLGTIAFAIAAFAKKYRS